MEEEGYASEDLLQRLLADYPDLLAGDQMDDVAPRRWLLVRRELGVPDAADAGDRWAVDHLFLDQDGVPTLVEVKRSTDTRLRREVVGQMLDYAAHAAAYWPPEKIRATFSAECEKRGETEEGALAEFLGDAADPTAIPGYPYRARRIEPKPYTCSQQARFDQSKSSKARSEAIQASKLRRKVKSAQNPALKPDEKAQSATDWPFQLFLEGQSVAFCSISEPMDGGSAVELQDLDVRIDDDPPLLKVPGAFGAPF